MIRNREPLALKQVRSRIIGIRFACYPFYYIKSIPRLDKCEMTGMPDQTALPPSYRNGRTDGMIDPSQPSGGSRQPF
ncbi:hypothetical protein O6P43_032357 [Quillaja saponaria]|uniref:Uncharacterized protein n=1 Tax=Quillaja saponaria TaxID=32244 RepID=A0AAD7KMU3_QUISA|nr:hypothetical protein O6P43_032357 [Quillaja saponaria]